MKNITLPKMPEACLNHKFGEEKTKEQCEVRILYERWARELALIAGHNSIATEHALTIARYISYSKNIEKVVELFDKPNSFSTREDKFLNKNNVK